MNVLLVRTFWALALLASLIWLVILLFAGSPPAAWLSTRFVIAQAVAFPGLLGVAGLGVLLSAAVTFLRSAHSRGTRTLAGLTGLALAVSSGLAIFDPYGAARNQAQNAPDPSCAGQPYTVTTFNALDTLTGEDLELLLSNSPDFLVLPEVSLDSVMLSERTSSYQSFQSTDTSGSIAPLTVLIHERLGTYTSREIPMTFGGLILSDQDGQGPTLLAVHTAPPRPSYMEAWRTDLATVEAYVAGESLDIAAGDFNATLLHGNLAQYAGARSTSGIDSALATQSVKGTWPAVGMLARFGLSTPIDHVMLLGNNPGRVQSVDVYDIGASDHRALTAEVELCSAGEVSE